MKTASRDLIIIEHFILMRTYKEIHYKYKTHSDFRKLLKNLIKICQWLKAILILQSLKTLSQDIFKNQLITLLASNHLILKVVISMLKEIQKSQYLIV